ncbi:porin family protein [Pseudaminobacter sp. 19-2017]|uniref:Porin family protein n=1 Tax=Pseudaminobacter soli (ex Zhang et al. 2022) TaxID=2831468 RepID=A0A942E1C7_9HYPH|nr:outer membrane beta-barrel protein [Pseudaminobacter soli]MBS3651298.1 porin family protein [Pseudaminobacter soli]
MSAKTTNFSLLSATALGLVAFLGINAANAADAIEAIPAPAMPMEEPPVAATWGGPYVGVYGGYGFSGTSEDEAAGNDIGTKGFLGGGFAGYNFDTGTGFVAGIEGDVGYSGVKGDNAGTTVKSGVDGSARARLGYTITPDLLAYATAGGAAKRMSVEEGGVKDSATQLGWTAGVGADMKITEKVFGRVEYRYTDYGSETFSTGSGDRDVSAKDHRIQMGLGVSF